MHNRQVFEQHPDVIKVARKIRHIHFALENTYTFSEKQQAILLFASLSIYLLRQSIVTHKVVFTSWQQLYTTSVKNDRVE